MTTAQETNPFRRVLDEFGPNGEKWLQKGTYDGEKRCLVIAVCSFAPGCLEEVAGVVAEQYPGSISDRSIGVTTGIWNDAPERTFEDIRAVLEKCAVKWDEALLAEGDT